MFDRGFFFALDEEFGDEDGFDDAAEALAVEVVGDAVGAKTADSVREMVHVRIVQVSDDDGEGIAREVSDLDLVGEVADSCDLDARQAHRLDVAVGRQGDVLGAFRVFVFESGVPDFGLREAQSSGDGSDGVEGVDVLFFHAVDGVRLFFLGPGMRGEFFHEEILGLLFDFHTGMTWNNPVINKGLWLIFM